MVKTEANEWFGSRPIQHEEITMKVYFAPQSRSVRTVWLLEEIGKDYELERFTLGQKEMRGPEYLEINPKFKEDLLTYIKRRTFKDIEVRNDIFGKNRKLKAVKS